MFLKIDPRIMFKKIKVGSTWQVRLGDAIVMVADDKKVPSTFVRSANRMLRAIGDSNTLWASAFLDGLMALFQICAADETKCRPTMRVDF